MFLKTNKIIRLVRDAYKVNLEIGNMEGYLVINGGKWAMCLDDQHIPKKIKAIVMELAGEMPRPNELFSLNKKSNGLQPVLEKKHIEDIFQNVDNAKDKIHVTPVMMQYFDKLRLMQVAKTTTIFGVREDYFDVVCKDLVNLDIEGEPTGPCAYENYENGVYWYNDICIFKCMPTIVSYTPLIGTLETVNFGGEV